MMNLANNIITMPIKTEVIIFMAPAVFVELPCDVINTHPAQIIRINPAYKEIVNNKLIARLTIAQILPAPTGFSKTTISLFVVVATSALTILKLINNIINNTIGKSIFFIFYFYLILR